MIVRDWILLFIFIMLSMIFTALGDIRNEIKDLNITLSRSK